MPISLLLSLASFFTPSHFTTVPSHPPPCRIYNTTFSQQSCGACSAFAMATVVSMHLCLRNHTDRIPSPYRLFDCTGKQCDEDGGVSLDDVSAIMREGVSDIDSSQQRFGLPCSENRPEIRFHTSHGLMISVTDIKTALLTTGLPLLGIISEQLLQEHDTGIYRAGQKQPSSHALVIIGWGPDHWIVQNSWGEGWGDGGGDRMHSLLMFTQLTSPMQAADGSASLL